MNLSIRNSVILHIIIGFLMTIGPFTRLYGLGVIVVSLYLIFIRKNANHEALLFAAYLVGAEVLLRMTSGSLLYETGKYGVLIFLVLGAFVGKNTFKPNVAFIFYTMLLLLGIVFTTAPEGASLRKAVAFNLSGPFLTGVCAFYFHKREINYTTMIKAMKYMVLPIISMCVYLFLRTPDLSEIRFGGVANFETSGGFGPNQVATILGLGIFLMGFLIITKNYLTEYLILDALILFYISYRGLLTFSRGGVLVGVGCLLVFVFFYNLSRPNFIQNSLKLILTLFVGAAVVWIITASATGGMLNNRYLNKNASGKTKRDVSAGRGAIVQVQLANFLDNPITGIGVGNGKFRREQSAAQVTAISHNEVFRLIEEHGLVGIFGLILLIVVPILMYVRQGNLERAFLVTFVLFWLLTINHSAMRIAFPSFIYGLALVQLKND